MGMPRFVNSGKTGTMMEATMFYMYVFADVSLVVPGRTMDTQMDTGLMRDLSSL